MGFLADPQKSLVSIGGNFFATPNTPADPRDCDRYPNSPYCNGGFLDRTPLGIFPRIIADRCNLGVEIQGTLGFIRLPPLQIVHRNPSSACQLPPPPPPEFPPITNNDCARNACNDGRVITTAWVHSDAIIGGLFELSQVPLDRSFVSRHSVDAQEASNYQYSHSQKLLDYIWRGKIPSYITNLRISIDDVGTAYNKDRGAEIYPSGWLPNLRSNPIFSVNITENGTTSNIRDTFTINQYGDYVGNIEYKECYFKVEYEVNNVYARSQVGLWFVTRFKKNLCEILPEPPPPPPKEECDCMSCCPQFDDTLLKLILKRIGKPEKVTIFDEDLERKGTQKANKTPESLNEYLKLTIQRIEIVNRLLGIDNYPMTVPDTMITPFQEGVFAKVFKFIDGKKKRKINSITELIAWMSEQDSAVLGEFHQVIEFEAEDKKKSSVVLPNVAEALKEIVLLTSQMAKQNNTQTELIFKIAAEVVATRAVATKGTAIAEDIQDYLDYPTERKTTTIPSSISLPKLTINKEGVPIATKGTEDHKNFLKPGEINIIYEDWNGNNSLHDQLLDLLQLASMLRAIYFQRTDR